MKGSDRRPLLRTLNLPAAQVRYRGMFKNTAQLKTLFALSNVWMARSKLMALDEQVRPLKTRAA